MEAVEAVEETLVAVSTVNVEKQLENALVEVVQPVPEQPSEFTRSNGVSEEISCPNSETSYLVESVNSESNNSNSELTIKNETIQSSDGNIEDVIQSTTELTDSLVTTVNIDVANIETEVEISNSDSAGKITTFDEIQHNFNNGQNSDNMPIETKIKNDNQVSLIDRLKFETEVVVEEEIVMCDYEKSEDDSETTNNILSQLEGQSIDLGEVLRSSDTPDCSENNNSFITKQVMNKEELLDILEGNDNTQDLEKNNKINESNKRDEVEIQVPDTPVAKLALQQLSKLKGGKRVKSKVTNQFLSEKGLKNVKLKTSKTSEIVDTKNTKKSCENIVEVLEKDWEDDEVEEDKMQNCSVLINTPEPKKSNTVSQEDINKQVNIDRSSVESSLSQVSEDSQNHSPSFNKGSNELQPQRRAGRVIKRKVIFDPDNYERGTNRKSKITQTIKEQSIKKGKADQNVMRSKSKSPITKTNWKKPQLKNSKQNKRLSEVDKLLMDEGAVNMIYQLTPEASRGKKNMKKKAELIKKINQSAAPDKEMKFRERRKDLKLEETEAKRVLAGKQRLSLSSSVKSPAMCEDVEAHSADDSIIYRRHSSSSYSSTCMSPRRLSDVDSAVQASSKTSRQVTDSHEARIDNETNVFLCDNKDPVGPEVIDKKDCLSIKEKLNSKLSRALNIKRKKESAKFEKPAKQKKSSTKLSEETLNANPEFHHISLSLTDNVAEICVHDTKSDQNVYNVRMINELSKALECVEKMMDISVTLLTSQSGNICSALDLKPLLNDNMEQRKNYANSLAESVRTFLYALERHSKLLAVGAAGACEGLALATLALCDVAVASDRATFALSAGRSSPLVPGVAVFTVHSEVLPKSLVDEMLVFGRQLSAAEALQRGLVSRTLWPDRFKDELHAMVRDIAAQPVQVRNHLYPDLQ
ncbi:Chromodomain Y-like protein 2 [Eumeta japonica]|uniref:Chromodomain Y-like protein 2 n=1 Tax=Eumeta variegata TaxID=151549 RepID=A0A4C1VAN4_EUMVA|nr:Chromodomain Y-like protein 2 [Eumeta japonica]